MEKENFNEGEKHIEIDQAALDRIRERLIQSLEESIKIYTHEGTKPWINEENCKELIQQIKNKEAGQIGGPFWAEHVGGAIEDEVIESKTNRDLYTAYRNALEEGK